MVFKAVVSERNLENIVEELRSIGFIEDERTQSMVYYKDTFYTMTIRPQERAYNIQESLLEEKLSTKHYNNEPYDELFDKKKYILKGEGEDLEIISFGNVYSHVLKKEGFSDDDIRHVASYETLSKHSRVINRLKTNRGSEEYEPPKIEDDINVVANLIEENIDMFKKYIKIEELNNILKENDPEEPKNSSISDMFKMPESHKRKFNMKYNLSDTRFNPGMRFYDSGPTIPHVEYPRSWVEEQLNSVGTQVIGLKKFSVANEQILMSLMSYLGSEDYKWQFENLNVDAEERYYPVTHAPVNTLYGNGFFMEHNGFDYSNKVFTLDPYNKVVQYWGVERPSHRENLETMVEVFPKLSA